MSTGRVPTTANSPLTTKGDLFTYDTSQARLAVGSNGETLVADSSTSTGLRYQPAKTTNHIINGGFDFWQRATSSTFTPVSGSPQYNSVDRFWFAASGTTGSMTASRQTADTVALQFALRFGRASGATATAAAYVGTNIESQQMKLLAGKAVVLSFYAKSGANFSYTPTVRLVSGTGTDQSPGTLFAGTWTGLADVVNTTFSPTSTMTRYTFTGTVPTTSNELVFWINWTPSGTAGANEWLQIEGVQLEVGSVATEFQRSGGTLAGELAACQRYYFRTTAGSNETIINCAFAGNTTTGQGQIQFPVPMRVAPTSLDSATVKFANYAGSSFNMTSVLYNQASTVAAQVYGTISGATAGHAGTILGQTTGSYIGLSAEL
jgi:hypothetical protein